MFLLGESYHHYVQSIGFVLLETVSLLLQGFKHCVQSFGFCSINKMSTPDTVRARLEEATSQDTSTTPDK